MAVANTLAYYDTATITPVKSFIVQGPGGNGRNDTQYNDTQHNDIQHTDTQHKGLACDSQHK